MGELMLETRDDINEAIQKHFKKQGSTDLADKLEAERNAYRDRMKTYFSSPALAKVFGKSQKVPKNPLTLLTEESTEMKRFYKSHPELKAAMEKALRAEKNKKRAKYLGSVIGIGTSAEIAREALGGR